MAHNKESYNKLWKSVISPLIEHYKTITWINFKDTAYDDIWREYLYFNEHCRQNYMSKEVIKLDGHKVSACYICAILKANPINIQRSDPDEETFITVIEQFAITVGLSILKSFIVCDKDREDNPKPREILSKDIMIFKNGFTFPKTKEEVNHGEYRNNFAVELYFTRKEGNYNILSLSHSLYLLEMYNRQRWEIQKKLIN